MIFQVQNIILKSLFYLLFQYNQLVAEELRLTNNTHTYFIIMF